MTAIHPIPRLSHFYDFFSVPNVSPPILRKFLLSQHSLVFYASWPFSELLVPASIFDSYSLSLVDLKKIAGEEAEQRSDGDFFELKVPLYSLWTSFSWIVSPDDVDGCNFVSFRLSGQL